MADPNPERSPGIQRQMEIYEQGLAGKRPEQPISIEELARAAKDKLKPEAYDYLAGGAGRRGHDAGESRRLAALANRARDGLRTSPGATSASRSSATGCPCQ